MNKKILLVEDDINLGSILKDFLQIKGYVVSHALNGEEGFTEFSNYSYDLCILDIMMPKKDGFTLAAEIRTINSNIPIIFLTAKSMQQDKINGFHIGADDYITKPFNTEELLLRITAIFRRVGLSKNEDEIFSIGKYIFKYRERTLKFEDSVIKLTSKENELLKLLCLHKNDVLDRTPCLKTIWKDDNYFTARSMDVYITKLRNYLKNDSSIEILNVHGQGFKLIC